MWARGDVDFDAGVGTRKGGEDVLQEGVHAAGAAGPVGVVEVEAGEGEDECADAVLEGC